MISILVADCRLFISGRLITCINGAATLKRDILYQKNVL